jgi:hypothetical protein
MFAQTLQQQRGFGSDFRFPGDAGGISYIYSFLGLKFNKQKRCVK